MNLRVQGPWDRVGIERTDLMTNRKLEREEKLKVLVAEESQQFVKPSGEGTQA